MEPKSTPKRYKIKSIFKSGKMRLEDRLKTVLGRSWPHLKVDVGHFLMENVEPVKNLGFQQKIVSRRVLSRFGANLGAKKGAKTSPKRTKN